MTAKQVAYMIESALGDCNFHDWDICHQIAQLYDEFENGDIEKEDIGDEIEALLSESQVLGYVVNKIRNAFIDQLQNN